MAKTKQELEVEIQREIDERYHHYNGGMASLIADAIVDGKFKSVTFKGDNNEN
jgi:hypothetical protein